METDFKTMYLFSKYKDKSLCNKINKCRFIEDSRSLNLNYTIIYKMIVNYQINKYGCQLANTGFEDRSSRECKRLSHNINKSRKYLVDEYTKRYLSEKRKEIC